MTNKLVSIINSLKVSKIKKILLYEMKFLVPNYSRLQNPWLGSCRPQIPFLSVLCPQLNLLNLLNPPPRTKFLGTPLIHIIYDPSVSTSQVTHSMSVIPDKSLGASHRKIIIFCYDSYSKHMNTLCTKLLARSRDVSARRCIQLGVVTRTVS